MKVEQIRPSNNETFLFDIKEDNFLKRMSVLGTISFLTLAGVNETHAQAGVHFSSEEGLLTEADSLLARFNKIDSTNRYTTKLEPGSKKVFIFIKQKHLILNESVLGRISSEQRIELLEATAENQQAIYNSFLELKEIFPEMETVHPEAIASNEDVRFVSTLASEKNRRALLLYFAKSVRVYFDKDHELRKAYDGFFEATTKDEIEETLKIFEKYFEKYKMAIGADFFLAQDNIRVCQSEDAGALQEAFEAFEVAHGDTKKPSFLKAQEKRESAVIEQISEQDMTVTTVIFGASHNFENNIEEWNKKNPDKKISYVLFE